MRLRWIAETDVAPLRALSIGHALYRGLEGADAPPAFLYGASLSNDAVVLGRNQRALDALDIAAVGERGLEVVRRATGGPSCVGGRGIFYVALGLRHSSVLMECPRDRILNRNVRGIMGGLALMGARAQYFGREWISVDKRPAALIGWTRLPDGGVLVEAFLSIDRPYWLPDELNGYPTREEMTLEAKDPIVMSEIWEGPRSSEELVRNLAEGHVDRFPDVELELDHSSLSDAERESADVHQTRATVGFDDAWDALSWSTIREVPIGFVSGGVSLDDEGLISGAAVAGDFYQDEDAADVLAKKLEGVEPSREAFAAALDAAWDGQNRVVEGLKDKTPVVDALVEAAS